MDMIDIARIANYGLHAEQLSIPVLNNFQVYEENNPQVVFSAMAGPYIEQVVSDGYIADGEFEERIDLVINNTTEYLKNNNIDTKFMYLKDYNNGVFDFKVYVQDMIVPTPKGDEAYRLFNAYFVEPRMHDFYQMSVSIGGIAMPVEILKLGTIDLENDELTKILNTMMNILLDNLKYKGSNKIKFKL